MLLLRRPVLGRDGRVLHVLRRIAEGDDGAALFPLAHAEGGEAREVLLDGVVDQEPPPGVHRWEQERSARRHTKGKLTRWRKKVTYHSVK